MELLLNGPEEFILFAIMMAVMSYLRSIMFAVLKVIHESELEIKKKKTTKKRKKELIEIIKDRKRQLGSLTFGLKVAMLEIFFIILRICSHAMILYHCGSWKASEGLWCHNILPFLDIFILTFLLGLFLYLAWVFFKYDIRPNLQKTGKLKSSQE
ncbi:MAG: hypothetical protein IIB94_14700 [Candidatus Marinimicrobia bacterium]|nr:hypothetical protein [Candidatus Neomarinimicrobiota bacterium]